MKKNIILVAIILATLTLLVAVGKESSNQDPPMPLTTNEVIEFIMGKGGQNVSQSDFYYLPHRPLEYTNACVIEYDMTDGGHLYISGPNYEQPFGITVIKADKTRVLLYERLSTLIVVC